MFTTRHIRANIVHSLGLTKGEVKWEGIMLDSSLLRREETKEEPAPTQIRKHSNTVERVIAHKENDPIDIQFDENNKLKKESLVDLLCDLDGMVGVERTNRGWFRRTFFGGGDQKEVVGEMQLKLLLSGKGKKEINEIYQRVTGETEGLDISKADLKAEATAPSSRFDFDHSIQSKITKFQIALIQDVDVVATLSSILLQDKDARTGLRAVLEGQTQILQKALNNPEKMGNFAKTLEESGVLERDPSFLEKVASVLLRMGISAGFSIFSAGALGGYMEQSKLRVNEGGEFKRDGLNLTAKKGFGTDGSVSAGVSADLVGIRGELNINDPETRIQKGIADVMSSDNILQASMELVRRVNEKYNAGARAENAPELSEKEQTRATTIANLGNAYLNAQEKLRTLDNSPAKTNALAQNTLIYLSKVEKLEGAQFKGIFAAANLAGVFVGLSGATADVSSSSQNLKVGAGVIEGQVLGTEKISEGQVQEKLNELGITREGNTYLQNGETLIEVPDGKKVQWQFEKIITDRDTIIRAIPNLIDANQTSQSTLISLKRENVVAKNEYIQANSQKVSELMHSLRQTDARTSSLQKAITEGKYDDATSILTSILQVSNNSTAKGLLTAMKELNSLAEKSDFFNLLLSKTSGGRMSLALGSKIDSEKDVSKDLRAYYEKIADAFAKQYGISKSQVMEQFNAIVSGGLTKDKVHQFGDTFKDGFTGVVAFSQINKGGTRFAELHKIINSNARMIGNPNEVTDTDFANKIREKIKAKITPAEIGNFMKDNPEIVGKDQEFIRSLMVAGKVSSYLSYEESAQCFNLGFVVEPGKLTPPLQGEKTDGTMVQGTTVGTSEGNMFMYGAGPGLSWDKIFKKKEEPKKEEPKKEEPKKEEPKKEEPKKEEPKEPETKPGHTEPTPPKPPSTEPGNTPPKPHPHPEPKPHPHPEPKPHPHPHPEPKPHPHPHPEPKPDTKPGVEVKPSPTPVPPPAPQTGPTTIPGNAPSAPPTVITKPVVEVKAPSQPVSPAAAPAAQNTQNAVTVSAPEAPNAAASAPIPTSTTPSASSGGRS